MDTLGQTYLIDGYNLMFAIGFLTEKTPLNQWNSSRQRLIDWLRRHAYYRHGDSYHVVFDAKTNKHHSPLEVFVGVNITFATNETADDYMIRMIQNDKNAFTVVTNDKEIITHAKRRQRPFLSDQHFVDRLLTTIKPEGTPVVNREDVERYLPDQEDKKLLEIFLKPKARRKTKVN